MKCELQRGFRCICSLLQGDLAFTWLPAFQGLQRAVICCIQYSGLLIYPHLSVGG